ncbi:MAG: hypothetical protein ABW092_18595 [Candidatus Thiodiazotropha sp.]
MGFGVEKFIAVLRQVREQVLVVTNSQVVLEREVSFDLVLELLEKLWTVSGIYV